MMFFKGFRQNYVKFIIANIIILIAAGMIEADKEKSSNKADAGGRYKYIPTGKDPFVPLEKGGAKVTSKAWAGLWRLTSILYDEKKSANSLATINDRIVKVGDVIKSRKTTVKIKKINRSSVELKFGKDIHEIYISEKKKKTN
jgi:hypothetical protein